MKLFSLVVPALAIIATLPALAHAVGDGIFTKPGMGITGSRHDINAYARHNTEGLAVTDDTQERLCAFCHTPHHAFDPAASNADYLPLWSHEQTAKNYTPYASDTLQASIGDPLIGPSRLCMSCHDGVIAVDTHYRNQGEAPTGAQLTGDIFSQQDSLHGAVGSGDSLVNDHPIGFNYIDARTADRNAGGRMAPGIKDENNPFLGNQAGVTIRDTLYLGTTMTCATCHDVHNKDNVISTYGGTETSHNYFIYAPQNGSQLCLSCHEK